jgi:hypothetical protein
MCPRRAVRGEFVECWAHVEGPGTCTATAVHSNSRSTNPPHVYVIRVNSSLCTVQVSSDEGSALLDSTLLTGSLSFGGLVFTVNGGVPQLITPVGEYPPPAGLLFCVLGC